MAILYLVLWGTLLVLLTLATYGIAKGHLKVYFTAGFNNKKILRFFRGRP